MAQTEAEKLAAVKKAALEEWTAAGVDPAYFAKFWALFEVRIKAQLAAGEPVDGHLQLNKGADHSIDKLVRL